MAAFDEAADGVSVIGPVRHHDRTFRHGLKQRERLRRIGDIAARQQEGQRPAVTFTHRMDLGVPAAPAHAAPVIGFFNSLLAPAPL